MSYYEKRIAELEARVAQLVLHQRMKAIPVEAQLIDRIAELKAENERLRKAGDAMANALWPAIPQAVYEVTDWEEAKKERTE